MRGMLRRWMAAGLVLALLIGTGTAGGAQAATGDEGDGATGSGGGLAIRLSEGSGTEGRTSPTAPLVAGVELDDAEVQAVIDRLPPWEADAADVTAFNRPVESLPPPRTGRTVDQPFPAGPDVSAPAVDTGPLKVLRVQPEGEVGIAPFVSVTFNQPMVPLATLGQLDALDVPARITPRLPGRWQWIGTRTLRFEHDPDIFDRLPMATSYSVEIPAGTRSQAGGVLAETFGFEFETPAPSVVDLIAESSPLGLTPIFLATFDQRVNPAAVLEAVTLEADGRQRPVRLATTAEVEADEDISFWIEYDALDGGWVAFRPVAPLEPESPVKVTVGPRVPSAEGPNTTASTRTLEARTYAPLQVEGTNCERWGCVPGDSLAVYFNNPLDVTTVKAAEFSITPAIPDVAISAYEGGASVSIDGPTADGTVYRVTVPASVRDVFGQRLGRPTTVEFEIEADRPLIYLLGGDFTTLDPLTTSQRLSVIVRQWKQLRVRLYAVDPSDYGAYRTFVSSVRGWRDPRALGVPWPLTADRTIQTGVVDGAFTEVPIDLSGALGGRHGHVVMIVEGAGLPRGIEDPSAAADPYKVGFPQVAWVQDTDIGVDLISDHRDVAVWTTDLRTGAPLAGVEIQLEGRGDKLATDEDGLARTALDGDSLSWAVASLGSDWALSPARVAAWPQEDQTVWYTTDDRAIYRPGETLHLKGWARNLDVSGDGGLEFLPSGELISYVAYDRSGNELAGGDVRTDALGGFDLAFELSAGANLGRGRISLVRADRTGTSEHTHSFQIQEFRRPEFEVETRLEAAGPHLIDEPALVSVQARYYSGGALAGAEVDWVVTTRPALYSPPGWREFTFGVWRPWWHYRASSNEGESGSYFGATDTAGNHSLRIDLATDGDGLPVAVTAEARVIDVNLQRWASASSYLAHAGELYVGLRSDRYFVRLGDGIDVQAVVTDIDGNPIADRAVEVTAARIVDSYVDGEWVEEALDRQTCEATSAQRPVACEFAAETGGRYRIAARVADDRGRVNRSEITRWVAGADAFVADSNVALEDAELIPDAATYAAGEVAEILVNSPFATASGVLTVAHDRIIETRKFDVSDHTAVLEVPITEAHVPELRVRVDLASVTARTAGYGTFRSAAPPRPAHASGEIVLRVPPVQRSLEVAVSPASTVVRPGGATRVDLEVRDAGGAPVAGAGVLVIVVDEAVLALTDYELIDPIEVFYRPRTARLEADRARRTILVENPRWLAGQIEFELLMAELAAMEAAGNAAAADAVDRSGGSGQAVDVRQDLNPLAIFEPDAETDADGRVTVEFELPDNLTRYRVMAVAADEAHRFGTGESAITARLPLQVRPSAPRFLNYGDEFELPITVQNLTDSAMEIDVVVQTANLELLGSAGRRVTVPANDRVAVSFRARTLAPGVARFRVAAVSAAHADAQVVSLPVYTPATSEAFAAYGVVDEGAVIQAVDAPTGVIPQFGGLEVNTSSTALSALSDAMLYLADYQYQCADAYAGRILAISALRDVLAAFAAEGLAGPADLDARVRSDISALAALQNSYDGGFSWWSRRQGSNPYTSVQAMHALVVARNNGFDVPPRVMEDGRWYLTSIERWIQSRYSQRAKDMLVAYALSVRALDGQDVADEARALWERRRGALPLDALAWLWPVVDDDGIEAEIGRILNNSAVETAGAATFATDYGEDAYLLLHSDRRTDGIVLDALITMAPSSELIPKVVAGLLAHRVRGRWNNVQENTFILLALGRYFDAFEATAPDFVARVWLGDLYAAEHSYAGRSADRAVTLIPMAELLAAGDSDLIVAKDGEGRLYYRLGLRYAPDDLDLEPLDRGFVVQRSYEAVGDPGDVRLDEYGVWHVRAGAEVRVNVSMVNDSRRTNMVLIDPLPAGLEPLNPALAVTGDVDTGDGRGWWRWTWYRHQNLRDDRAEAFASYLWAGTHEYSYVARATTPGTFVVPPARAEEIYAPEVFGRSGSDTLVVYDSR
ncbi:MAG: hypothetical protein F4X37_03125 [Acidimicrobiia bacterium]|nr:hypothetical protein [Acidimicrobiia bacterium]